MIKPKIVIGKKCSPHAVNALTEHNLNWNRHTLFCLRFVSIPIFNYIAENYDADYHDNLSLLFRALRYVLFIISFIFQFNLDYSLVIKNLDLKNCYLHFKMSWLILFYMSTRINIVQNIFLTRFLNST